MLKELMEKDGVVFTFKGGEYWASCPFHEDKTPSMSVTVKNGRWVWHCFSCRRGGTAEDYLVYSRGVSRTQAKRLLNPRPLTFAEEHMASFVDSLKYHPYLLNRGVTEEQARQYGVGVTGPSPEFDIHEESVVFPYSLDGKVGFFVWRSLSGKRFGSTKGHPPMLWGLDQAKPGEVFVVEGQFDAMALARLGVSAVAMNGTHWYQEYWDQLEHIGAQSVVFVPDGDLAGKAFLEKLAFECLDIDSFVVDLPGVDPDESPELVLNSRRYLPLEWYVLNVSGTALQVASSLESVIWRLKYPHRQIVTEAFVQRFGSDYLSRLRSRPSLSVRDEQILVANCAASDQAKSTVEGLVDALSSRSRRQIETGEADVAPNLAIHDRLVRRLACVRKKQALYRALDKAVSSLDEDAVPALIDELSSIMYKPDTVKHVSAAMLNLDKQQRGIKIGRFPTLDSLSLGFAPGRLWLIAGPTGHGKTTLALNLLDCLLAAGGSALFVSLEMTISEIVYRQMAIYSGVSVTSYMLGEVDREIFDRAASWLAGANLSLAQGVYDLPSLLSTIKATHLKSKLDVVFIDYLQLIRVPGKTERWLQLMQISGEVKRRLCNDLGLCVVLLSQLGKQSLQSEVAESKDISGSYGVLADADMAITLRQVSKNYNLELFVDKHRYGGDKVLIPAILEKGTQRVCEYTA